MKELLSNWLISSKCQKYLSIVHHPESDWTTKHKKLLSKPNKADPKNATQTQCSTQATSADIYADLLYFSRSKIFMKRLLVCLTTKKRHPKWGQRLRADEERGIMQAAESLYSQILAGIARPIWLPLHTVQWTSLIQRTNGKTANADDTEVQKEQDQTR